MAYEYTTQGYTVNDSGRRLVVDPVTRIEGHLRCEVNINDDNVITNAVSCGTMFRGLESSSRIVTPETSGLCGTHLRRLYGHARTRLRPCHRGRAQNRHPRQREHHPQPDAAALWYHDHLVHFYQLGGLDWIDVVSASKADPKETSRLAQSLSPWPQSSPAISPP